LLRVKESQRDLVLGCRRNTRRLEPRSQGRCAGFGHPGELTRSTLRRGRGFDTCTKGGERALGVTVNKPRERRRPEYCLGKGTRCPCRWGKNEESELCQRVEYPLSRIERSGCRRGSSPRGGWKVQPSKRNRNPPTKAHRATHQGAAPPHLCFLRRGRGKSSVERDTVTRPTFLSTSGEAAWVGRTTSESGEGDRLETKRGRGEK